MKTGLRVQLIGTLIGAILIFFAISAIAANTTMSSDLSNLAKREVTSGALGFSGYWDSKKDQVRLLTTQIAIQDAIRKDVQTKNGKALGDALSNIARGAELSFLTVTDTNGKVIARANGGSTGVKIGSPYIDRALTGETVSTAAKSATPNCRRSNSRRRSTRIPRPPAARRPTSPTASRSSPRRPSATRTNARSARSTPAS